MSRLQDRFGKLLPFLPAALFLLMAVVFFSPFFLQGKVFLAADALYQYYPWKAYAPAMYRPKNPLITDPVNGIYSATYNRQLKSGTLSSWNPYILNGLPSAGNVSTGHPGRFYPVKLFLHRLFSTNTSINLLLFAHVFFMGCFMYLYLREMGVGWRGALFGGTAYMFNGHAMVWLEFEFVVTVSACLPLLLLFMERFRTPSKYLYACAGALVLGTIGLLGQFQYATYVGILMFFYLAFLLVRSLQKKGLRNSSSVVACFAITTSVGLMISAIEILPMLELIGSSSRVHRTFEFGEFFTTLGRVPFRYFVTLLFPDYFGSPVLYFNIIPKLPTQEYMNYNELCIYAGIPTLFAVVAFLVGVRRGFDLFTLILGVAAVGVIAGTFLYYPFFALVPGMNKANPTRLIFLFVFAVSVAAGAGVGSLWEFGRRRQQVFVALSLLLLLLAAGLGYFSAFPEVISWFNRENLGRLSGVGSPLLERIASLRAIDSPVITRPLFLVAGAGLLFILTALFRRRRAGTVFFFGIIALLGYDLVSFGRGYNTTVEEKFVYAATPSIEFLQRQEGPFRVVQDQGSGLYVNTLVPFGIEEVGGYSSAYPDSANKLLSFIQYGPQAHSGVIFDRWVMLRNFRSPLLDLLNAKYVLRAPGAGPPGPGYRLVFRQDLAVYENTAVMPRAFAVHRHVVKEDTNSALRYMGAGRYDMRGEVVLEQEPRADFLLGIDEARQPPRVSIASYTPDEVNIIAEMSTNGWLVLSDTFFPGWTAQVNGEDAPLLRANCTFRAVPLPGGTHRVTFLYRPQSVRYGWLLTLAGLALGTGGLVASLLVPRRGRRKAITPPGALPPDPSG